jgi:formylglycine-generating enzyme required for sulfatase activity
MESPLKDIFQMKHLKKPFVCETLKNDILEQIRGGKMMIKMRLGLIVSSVLILLFAFSVNADAGLISWWKFDEGSGTTAGDSEGSNDGTLYPASTGPTWTTDTAGGASTYALDFDGSEDYVNCGNGSSLDITGAITIEAWVKTTSAAYIVEKFSTNSPWNGYGLGIDTGADDYGKLNFWTDGMMSWVKSTGTVTDGNLHHVAVTGNGSSGTFYIDGVSNGSFTYSPPSSSANTLYIGSKDGAERYFNGIIDDVRIWDHALTEDDILWHKNNPGQIIPEPGSLLLLGMGLLGILVFRMKKEKKVNRYGRESVFKRLVLIVGLLALLLIASPGWAISWVTVGDAGNADDTANPYGAVSYTYYISKYETTNQEYGDFLNDVATTNGDTHSLYNAKMGSNDRGGITRTGSGTVPDPYVYTIKTVNGASFADRPVIYVSWYDAARFSNWLHSGDTESGVYNTSDWSYDHSNGNYWIPTEDEWYKAAYYSGSGTTYYKYATKSDGAPTAATADSSGNVTNPGAKVANYNSGFDWNGEDGNVSIVGDCGSPSHYGTFDQSGNVWEWNEDWHSTAGKRVRRGGSWSDPSSSIASLSRCHYSPDTETNVGFRVASSIPEPSPAPQ